MKNKLAVFDSVMLFWDDPRLPIDTLEDIKAQAHLFNMVFSYDTSNIYICNAIKKETRAYMIIRKAQGKELTFDTALIEVVVGRLNHENMHRILYKTIDKKAAVFYDRLMGGKSTGKGSYSATDYTSDEILP